jgi:hypothetical protein
MIWEYKELCTSEDLISAGGFRLAAVARTSLLGAENTAECISTAGDIEYWVNMASQAKETTTNCRVRRTPYEFFGSGWHL